MNDKGKALKVTAIVASSLILLSLMLSIIIFGTQGFNLYSDFGWLIAIGACIILWKMFIDRKNIEGNLFSLQFSYIGQL